MIQVNGKIYHVPGLKKINIVKTSILPKAIYRFQCSHYQNTSDIFHRTRTKIFKFVWKHKRLKIAKAILRKIELGESGSLTSDYTTKLQ